MPDDSKYSWYCLSFSTDERKKPVGIHTRNCLCDAFSVSINKGLIQNICKCLTVYFKNNSQFNNCSDISYLYNSFRTVKAIINMSTCRQYLRSVGIYFQTCFSQGRRFSADIFK